MGHIVICVFVTILVQLAMSTEFFVGRNPYFACISEEATGITIQANKDLLETNTPHLRCLPQRLIQPIHLTGPARIFWEQSLSPTNLRELIKRVAVEFGEPSGKEVETALHELLLAGVLLLCHCKMGRSTELDNGQYGKDNQTSKWLGDYHLLSQEGQQYIIHSQTLRVFKVSSQLAHIFDISMLRGISRNENLKRAVLYLKRFTEHVQTFATRDDVEPLDWRRAYVGLHVTYDCNLQCGYCQCAHLRQGTSQHMSLRIAKKAVDFILDRFAPKAQRVPIGFTLTGEPLLVFDIFRHIYAYAKAASERRGKYVSFGINTNGTLIGRDFLEFLHGKEDISLAISLDGPKEVHDATRQFTDGLGTYECVRKNVTKVLKASSFNLSNARGVATITAKHPRPAVAVKHLLNLGFKHVGVTHVRASPESVYGLNDKSLAAFCQGYDEYAELFCHGILKRDNRYYHFLDHTDFFLRFLIRVMLGQKLQHRCEAGRTWISIAPDGRIFPCDGLVGIEEFCLGDIFDGINEKFRHRYLSLSVDSRSKCKDCWARYLCGGECYLTSFLATGTMDCGNHAYCQLVQHIIGLAVGVCFKLYQNDPLAYGHLQHCISQSLGTAVGRIDGRAGI